MLSLGVAGQGRPGWAESPQTVLRSPQPLEDLPMAWTKPELEVVSVTMEVTAYAATL